MAAFLSLLTPLNYWSLFKVDVLNVEGLKSGLF
jgi:hypothetical protein